MMSKTLRPAAARIAAGTIVLALLSACGGDKPAATTETTTATTTAETEATAPVPAADMATAPAPAAAVTLASFTGDPVKGEKVFGQCRTCHVVQEGVNRVGPSLWDVVGRKSGSIEGFRYSAANKNSGFIWTEDQLFTYLEAPQRVLKGTTMGFAGLKDPQDRADVIAYLKTNA